jgi:hypothetical protein
MLNRVIQILAFPVFVGATFLLDAFGLEFAGGLLKVAAIKEYYLELGLPFSIVRTLIFLSLLVPSFIVAVCISLVFSHLSAMLYRRNAVWVAIASTLPVLYVSLTNITFPDSFERFSDMMAWFVYVFELSSFVILLCGGAWLTNRQLEAKSPVAS